MNFKEKRIAYNEALAKECKFCCRALVGENIKEEFCCYKCQDIFEDLTTER